MLRVYLVISHIAFLIYYLIQKREIKQLKEDLTYHSERVITIRKYKDDMVTRCGELNVALQDKKKDLQQVVAAYKSRVKISEWLTEELNELTQKYEKQFERESRDS